MLKNVPTKCPSPKGAGGLGTWLSLPGSSSIPKGTSIGSSVFVGLSNVSNTQTDRQTTLHRQQLGRYFHCGIITSLCRASFVGSQRDATHTCCRAPAPAARRPQLSIFISCPKGAKQQTRLTPLLLSIDGRQTEGRPTVTKTLLCTLVSNKANICMAQNKAVALGEQTLPAVGNLPPLFIGLRRQKSI